MKFKMALFLLSLIGFTAQADVYPDHGLVESHYIKGDALKNNVLHLHHGREVIVYLPRGYYENRQKHYPVVYVLHGAGGLASSYFNDDPNIVEPDLQPMLDGLISAGDMPETIVVVADFDTRHFGGWYQNSPVTGFWRDYFIEDLIPQIDTKFRTLATPDNRALLGQSMGGYGALSIMLERPELFSAVTASGPAWMLLRTLPAPAFAGVYSAIQPQLANYTGKREEMTYFAHIFMALAQVNSHDVSNPPSFIKQNFSFADFQAISNLSLEYQINQPEIANNDYSHLAVFTGMGEGEGEQSLQSLAFINDELSNLGLDLSSKVYPGGHGENLKERIAEALVFIGQEFK
ncbi:hypothetical protein HR060_05400 [Catenovulum sp. SM1970]|uniref:alpha/beta hydrolase n=1 Tax=Marinifaba aquimaris TaxID=2741323 RepID=UPI0015732A10|nr:alpha/beta hydrolase-fold protein [Marinifaba aquimaris]NTS76299.1 hypothetical protein [Marinifaba aquimaris]